MATNPNYPDPRNRRADFPDPELPQEKRAGVPWPLIAIVVAGLILAAFIYYLPRMPKESRGAAAGQVPDQPFLDELQVSNLKIVPAPVGNQIYLTGQLQNTGNHTVNGITIDAIFRDANGQQVQRETRQLEALAVKGNGTQSTTFADSPMKPKDSRAFRVGFDNMPNTWNHEVPEMRIVHVAWAGGGGAGQVPASGIEGGQAANPPEAGATGTTQVTAPATGSAARQKAGSAYQPPNSNDSTLTSPQGKPARKPR